MNDFRGKTCGECAWGYRSGYGDAKYLHCRRVHFDTQTDLGSVGTTVPACPAFEPLEKPEEAAE